MPFIGWPQLYCHWVATAVLSLVGHCCIVIGWPMITAHWSLPLANHYSPSMGQCHGSHRLGHSQQTVVQSKQELLTKSCIVWPDPGMDSVIHHNVDRKCGAPQYSARQCEVPRYSARKCGVPQYSARLCELPQYCAREC